MTPEDQLADVTAGLITLEENEIFLERLFYSRAGEWLDVESLCIGLTRIEGQLKSLLDSLEGTLHVTWLEYPHSAYGEGYCVIVFFLESLHWSNVALYNRQRFLDNLAR